MTDQPPDPGDRPLFADRAPSGEPFLFPPSGRRPPVPEKVPEPPPTVRRVRTGTDDHAAPGAPPPGRQPPPMPAPADAAGPTSTVLMDPRVGVVTGAVAATTTRAPVPGFPVLAAAAVVAVAAVAFRALVGGAGRGVLAAGVLGPVALVATAWLARWMTGRLPVAACRLRVQPPTGMARTYLLDGELPPGALRPGDIVRVTGGRARDGDTVARSVEILATLNGPVVRAVAGRRSGAAAVARGLSGLCVALAVLVLAGAALVAAGATR